MCRSKLLCWWQLPWLVLVSHHSNLPLLVLVSKLLIQAHVMRRRLLLLLLLLLLHHLMVHAQGYPLLLLLLLLRWRILLAL